MKRKTRVLILLSFIVGMGAAALPHQWTKVCSQYDTSTGDPNHTSCPVPHRSRATLKTEYNYVHVFGGSSGSVPRSDMWTYSVLESRWRQDSLDWRELTSNWTLSCKESPPPQLHEELPLPRVGAALFHDTSELLFVGGGTCRQPPWAEDSSVPVNDFWLYAHAIARWAPIQSPEPPRVKGAATIIWNRRMFVIFGQNTQFPHEYTNSVWTTDLVSDPKKPLAWTKVEPIVAPPPRAEHTCVLSGDEVFMFGGRNSTAAFGDMWKLNLITNLWNPVAPYAPEVQTPSARFGHASAICHNAAPDKSDVVLIHGGSDVKKNLLGDTFAFSIGQRTWWQISPTERPAPRKDAAIHCSREGQVWLFGGEGADGTIFNDFFTLI